MTFPGLIWRIGCFSVILFAGGSLSAQTTSATSTTTEPGVPTAYPEWLKPVASTVPDTTLSQLAYTVTVPAGLSSSDLLLTIIFDEGGGGFLRVYRQDGAAAEMISENLFEGTGLPNRRILLLHNVGSQGQTTLTFQASAAAQPIRKIVWNWPSIQAVPVTGALPALIQDHIGRSAEEVSGQALSVPQPDVDVDYTSTPLLSQPTRVEGVATFAATLDRLPWHAVLTSKVTGLPLTEQMECWINGRRIGVFAASLPSLQDPAYLLSTGQLAAWRKASLYIPAAAWQRGDNQIELHPVNNPGQGYALKDVVLEFVYDATSPTLPTP